jgi:hypothetical protein
MHRKDFLSTELKYREIIEFFYAKNSVSNWVKLLMVNFVYNSLCIYSVACREPRPI